MSNEIVVCIPTIILNEDELDEVKKNNKVIKKVKVSDEAYFYGFKTVIEKEEN